jgi:hypothetical protein
MKWRSGVRRWGKRGMECNVGAVWEVMRVCVMNVTGWLGKAGLDSENTFKQFQQLREGNSKPCFLW